ncbi:hypothetical protein [Pectobacterium zantedeschiae]|uniref:Uncharacterized protein n=1 Tax=Pectobacterium zantedeschiae TaxID=2034769 RepID=A0A9X8JJG6_9GAMM|nr:hypothetical protein [Pectobacterium zantedeschiae]RYC44601.1 hypothetical protein CLR69_06170 [Pectobacterium zantedeschiae]RYC49759.1 hypothetical protein CTN06_01970 [Pectobacterium zantedeschiae]
MEKTVPELKEFTPGNTRRYEQANMIWYILSGYAHANKESGKLITYGELAELMGYGRRAGRGLKEALALVSLYSLYNNLAPMSVIVVNQVTEEPGFLEMLREGRTLAQEQNAVFDTNWYKYRVPSPGTFRKVAENLSWDDVR